MKHEDNEEFKNHSKIKNVFNRLYKEVVEIENKSK